MLERIQDAPERALALKASGTVMARDIEAAVDAALGDSTVATGLVLVIDPDFDGYYAEVARGLSTVSAAHKAIVRIAVVADAGQIDEARISGLSDSGVKVRFFEASEKRAAFAFADATQPGE